VAVSEKHMVCTDVNKTSLNESLTGIEIMIYYTLIMFVSCVIQRCYFSYMGHTESEGMVRSFKLAQAVTLLTFIREAPVRISAETSTILTTDFGGFPQVLLLDAGVLLYKGNDRFLPRYIQFIIQYHTIIRRYTV
jgi:hypothetical protein